MFRGGVFQHPNERVEKAQRIGIVPSGVSHSGYLGFLNSHTTSESFQNDAIYPCSMCVLQQLVTLCEQGFVGCCGLQFEGRCMIRQIHVQQTMGCFPEGFPFENGQTSQSRKDPLRSCTTFEYLDYVPQELGDSLLSTETLVIVQNIRVDLYTWDQVLCRTASVHPRTPGISSGTFHVQRSLL